MPELNDINSLIENLQTKEGADSFIAERKRVINSYLPKLGKSMRARALQLKDRLDNQPNKFVAEVIQKNQKRLVELNKQNAEMVKWQQK
jgi:hypothetical protein